MSTLTELMKIADQNKARNKGAVQAALEEKRRREESQRRAREEQERKEQERQKALRLKRMEDEKREAERQRRKEAEDQAREAARLRKEEEHRNSLLYGSKKSKSDSRTSRPPQIRQRLGDDNDSDNDSLSAMAPALTREELRQRKQDAAMKKMFTSPKRPAQSSNGTRKMGKKLRGGAVDIPLRTDSPIGNGTGGIKDRLIKQDMGLIKLNTVKRDQRTVDEILTDVRARKGKGPVLEGDAAKEFTDWFGDSKKKQGYKPIPASHTPPIDSPDSSLGSVAGRSSAPPQMGNKNGRPVAPIPQRAIPRSSIRPPIYNDSRPSSAGPNPSSKSSSRNHTPTTSARPSAPVTSKKRRSSDRSVSPPPRRRKVEMDEYEDVDEDDGPGYDRSEIWSLFGKDRKAYMDRDVYSDESDGEMEVDTRFMEQEEKRSALIARREDEEALLAERRHEQEKAKRRKEKLGRDRR